MAHLLRYRQAAVHIWRGCISAHSDALAHRALISPGVSTGALHQLRGASGAHSYMYSKTEFSVGECDRFEHDIRTNNNDDFSQWILRSMQLALGAGVVISILAFLKRKRRDSTRARCASINRSQRFNFLAEAVEIASPSVVYIEKEQVVSTFFGEMVGVSSGSGFIVLDGRYVLTNAHVVANSRSVQVKLVSGRVVKGEVTDTDQVADLALIKLDLPANEHLPAVKFGSSSSLRPGEWVVALGSPLNLTNTMTAGIVSSVLRPSRELGLEQYKPDMEYVQTDAPITHGNSGGPLVNLDGEVIGVNTMTAGPGISFAIPSDFALNFVQRANKIIKKQAKVTKYAIGVSMLSISPSIMRIILQRISLPDGVTHGVFLANVWPNSPAAQAGLHKGDVIVRVNGRYMYSSKDVNEMVQKGEKLNMEVVRKGKWVNISVVPVPLYGNR